ncbi:hypothetical protein PLESTF_000853600 [Pleodorina starrii]|nr:hypothetical protein PLESTF_000853600 [Pleodorina starrii]
MPAPSRALAAAEVLFRPNNDFMRMEGGEYVWPASLRELRLASVGVVRGWPVLVLSKTFDDNVFKMKAERGGRNVHGYMKPRLRSWAQLGYVPAVPDAGAVLPVGFSAGGNRRRESGAADLGSGGASSARPGNGGDQAPAPSGGGGAAVVVVGRAGRPATSGPATQSSSTIGTGVQSASGGGAYGSGANVQNAAVREAEPGASTAQQQGGSPIIWNGGGDVPVVDSARFQDLLRQRRNMVIQGCAGAGKSTLIREHLIPALKRIHGDDCVKAGLVHICATTGTAALNIGGRTLASTTGVGYCNGSTSKLLADLESWGGKNSLMQTIKQMLVLVLDEAFLTSGEGWDSINAFLQRLAEELGLESAVEPFIGIQIVILMDACQLGPVAMLRSLADRVPSRRIFEAGCWNQLKFVYLLMPEHSERHRHDEPFFKALQELASRRESDLESQGMRDMLGDAFQRGAGYVGNPANWGPELCGNNSTVKTVNSSQLMQLRTEHGCPLMTYMGVRGVTCSTSGQQCIAGQEMDLSLGQSDVDLCVGALVIATKPLDGVPTGTRGVVEGFQTDYSDGGLFWKERDPRWSSMRRDIFDAAMKKVHSDRLWPRVVFKVSGRDVIMLVKPIQFVMETVGGVQLGTNLQLPLMLSYAMTVHRSQSLTLDRIVVRLGRTAFFEPGHLYTALSRVRRANDILILGSLRSLVGVRGSGMNPLVRTWLEGVRWERLRL